MWTSTYELDLFLCGAYGGSVEPMTPTLPLRVSVGVNPWRTGWSAAN